MTDREKLVELIRWIGMLEIEDCEYIADRLIANGVTAQTPKKLKQSTDLTGKCGNCAEILFDWLKKPKEE